MAFLSSLFGGGGGGGGLSLKTSTQSDTGPQDTGSYNAAASGAGISVLSPGAGINLGSAGVIMLALIGLVGIIFVIRDL